MIEALSGNCGLRLLIFCGSFPCWVNSRRSVKLQVTKALMRLSILIRVRSALIT